MFPWGFWGPELPVVGIESTGRQVNHYRVSCGYLGFGAAQSSEDVKWRERAGTVHRGSSRRWLRSGTIRALSGPCLRLSRQPGKTETATLRTSQISELAANSGTSRRLESAPFSSAWWSSPAGWCTKRTVSGQSTLLSAAEMERNSIQVGRRRTSEVYRRGKTKLLQ